MELARPFNLLMPFRGHTLTVEVLNFTEGELPAKVDPNAPHQLIRTVRLFTRRLDKPSPATHVDVTSSAPAAMLDGFLRTGQVIGKQVTFRARGRGPLRRDTIHIKPLSPEGAGTPTATS